MRWEPPLQCSSAARAVLYALAFTFASLALQTFASYHRYTKILKWLAMVLLLYVAATFAVHPPWGTVLHATFLPSISFKSDYLAVLVAVLGTTISPYLFFWQASLESEETKIVPGKNPCLKPRSAPARIPPHPPRHLCRHDPLQLHRILHHRLHCIHAARRTTSPTSLPPIRPPRHFARSRPPSPCSATPSPLPRSCSRWASSAAAFLRSPCSRVPPPMPSVNSSTGPSASTGRRTERKASTACSRLPPCSARE